MTNSERFINSFVAIEMHLRSLVGGSHIPFNQLVYEAGKKDSIIYHYAQDLNEFSQLRNAITHNRAGESKVIAEPHDEVVREIEAIYKSITDIKTILSVLQKSVYYVDVKDDFKKLLEYKKDHGYSVVPVYNKGVYHGLLHADLYMRCLEEGLGFVDIDSIESLLKYANKKDRVVFLSKKANLADALKAFNDQQLKGMKLNAIIITEDGFTNQEPLGILTLKDLPMILSNLNK